MGVEVAVVNVDGIISTVFTEESLTYSDCYKL